MVISRSLEVAAGALGELPQRGAEDEEEEEEEEETEAGPPERDKTDGPLGLNDVWVGDCSASNRLY